MEVVEVHALKHARPIFRLGTACARLNRDEAIAVIVLPREQRLLLDLVHLRLQPEERLVDFRQHVGVARFLCEFVADRRIIEQANRVFERLDLCADDLAFGDHLLRLLWVVPEFRSIHAVVVRRASSSLITGW